MSTTQDEATGLTGNPPIDPPAELNWRAIGNAHRDLATLAHSLQEQIAARNEALSRLAQADENIEYVSGRIDEARVGLAALEATK